MSFYRIHSHLGITCFSAWQTVANSLGSPKNAVAALIKRLAHRNANVQIYTLEVSLRVQNRRFKFKEGLWTNGLLLFC